MKLTHRAVPSVDLLSSECLLSVGILVRVKVIICIEEYAGSATTQENAWRNSSVRGSLMGYIKKMSMEASGKKCGHSHVNSLTSRIEATHYFVLNVSSNVWHSLSL